MSAVLVVKVKPSAREDAVTGVAGEVVRVSVRAAPERGRANEAVCRVIAAWLGCARSSVSVVSGMTSREKRLRIEGVSADQVRARLGTLF